MSIIAPAFLKDCKLPCCITSLVYSGCIHCSRAYTNVAASEPVGEIFYFCAHRRNAKSWWHAKESRERYNCLYSREEMRQHAAKIKEAMKRPGVQRAFAFYTIIPARSRRRTGEYSLATSSSCSGRLQRRDLSQRHRSKDCLFILRNKSKHTRLILDKDLPSGLPANEMDGGCSNCGCVSSFRCSRTPPRLALPFGSPMSCCSDDCGSRFATSFTQVAT